MNLNPFAPNSCFHYPLKTSEKHKIFWCFQGVERLCIGNEWVTWNKYQLKVYVLLKADGCIMRLIISTASGFSLWGGTCYWNVVIYDNSKNTKILQQFRSRAILCRADISSWLDTGYHCEKSENYISISWANLLTILYLVRFLSINFNWLNKHIMLKMSVFGVFLVRIQSECGKWFLCICIFTQTVQWKYLCTLLFL